MGVIVDIDLVTLVVDDQDEAIEFYVDTLDSHSAKTKSTGQTIGG